MKIIDTNKKAYFDYYIEETIEAGIALKGSEVKSIRQGNVNLKDSFCFFEGGCLVLKNCHIAPYSKGSAFNEPPLRDRQLLLHKKEITRLYSKTREKGYTLVVTKLYLSKGRVKLELGLGKGKHTFDKRAVKREKDLVRLAEREIKEL